MDKFKTIGVGGLPHTLNDFRQFLGRLDAPSEGIYQAFNNLLRGFGDDFIVQGCVVSGSTGAFSITEGWILLSGELIKVDAQGPFDEAVDGTFTKVTTFDSRGTKTFLNGSINETYEKNRGVISGLGGTLAFNANTFFDLSNQASSLPDTGVKILNKKIIEIGNWNMNTTLSVSVAHGLSDASKIRTIDVMILADGVSIPEGPPIPLNTGTPTQGGLEPTTSSNIVLLRLASGLFDDVSFFSQSGNRGFITIEFEA